MLKNPVVSFLSRPVARTAAVIAVVMSVAACQDLTSIDPSFANVTDSDTVYALSGSAPGASNALHLFSGSIFRADQGFGFDVAFDIDTLGRAVIIPVRALATEFSQPYSVGLQAMQTSFEAVLTAPKEGYRVDTALVVPVGVPVVIESHDFTTCAYAIKGQSYFSKLVVTDIDIVKRKLAVTVTVDRNCGFRSFELGLPRN